MIIKINDFLNEDLNEYKLDHDYYFKLICIFFNAFKTDPRFHTQFCDDNEIELENGLKLYTKMTKQANPKTLYWTEFDEETSTIYNSTLDELQYIWKVIKKQIGEEMDWAEEGDAMGFFNMKD